MSKSQKRTVDCVSYGQPPKKILEDIETIKFTIYDFKELSQKRGESIESPVVKAHGYEWKIRIYPRGISLSDENVEHISCYLRYESIKARNSVTAKYTIHLGKQKHSSSSSTQFNANSYTRGWRDFEKRDEIIKNHLEDDGSLIVQCDIRIAEEDKRVWYPKKLVQQDLLVELYEDASSKTSDVIFLVEETMYQVHSNILSLKAKRLHEIAKECDSDGVIPINSTKKEIFKMMLDFIYTVKAPDIDKEEIAKEVIIAADLYECIHLKLYAESFIVDKFLRPENAAALLIFADSHSCALMKEAAMDLFATDGATAKSAQAWSDVKESKRLLAELFDRLVGSNDPSDQFEEMSVVALRDNLQSANLELDGSREVLVKRLKTYQIGEESKRKRRRQA